MKKCRAILGAVLGLALTVPLSPMTAEAAGGRWGQVDTKTRRYFVPDGQVEKQTTVLGSTEKLLSSTPQTQRGRLLESGVDKIGAVSSRDEANAAKDKVTVVPGAAEAVGNEWFEYETVKREKAFNRFYSQQELDYNLYAEQIRTAHTYQVTDKVRTTETWTDPVTKQTQRNVADSTQTRNEIRYSAWTETSKKLRVDAGNRTRTWGPDLVFAKVPDEQRIAKRTPLTPPGGMEAGWWLMDSETFRFFVAGSTPPKDAKAATDAKAEEIRQGTGPSLGGANSDWSLVNSETVRYFLAGATAPAGAVAANPEQKAAMVNPVNSGWSLANSELIRYFVPGITPPKDAKLASPEEQAAAKATPSNEWHLIDVATFRNFLAGNVPPQNATRSGEQAGTDPSGNGDWALDHLQSFRFFVPIPGDFENPAPEMPPTPAPRVEELGVDRRVADATAWEPAGIEKTRQGLLIKQKRLDTRKVPQYRIYQTIHSGYVQETYTTYEHREIPINTGGGLEMMAFQVPVKNYKWKLVEYAPIRGEEPLADFIDKRYVQLADLRANEVAALAAAEGDRPTSFQGDSGSGGKSDLSAAKVREKMGANEVKASSIALTAAQVEEARKIAEEQARQQLEEDKKKKDQEEEQRKKDREATTALAALEKAYNELVQRAEDVTAKAKDKIEAASAEIAKVKAATDRTELEKSLQDVTKAMNSKYDDASKEFKSKYEDAKKDHKKIDEMHKAVNKKLDELTKTVDDKLASLSDKVADANKKYEEEQAKLANDPATAIAAIQKEGSVTEGEENFYHDFFDAASVKAYYSRNTGNWVILGYTKHDQKGDAKVLFRGTNKFTKGDNKNNPLIKEFSFKNKDFKFYLNRNHNANESSWDAIIEKKGWFD